MPQTHEKKHGKGRTKQREKSGGLLKSERPVIEKATHRK